jgi:S1-C subfamily serine protease
MTILDWSIVFFVTALAVWGFNQGAVIGVSSVLGFLGGIWIGTHLASTLLEKGNASPYTPLFALAAALIVGGVIAEITLLVGFKVRVLFTSRAARRIDGAVGAALLASFALGIVWVGSAAIAQSHANSKLRMSVRQSAVVKQLNAVMPPSGGLLAALSRIDPVPSINGPAPNVPAPDSAIAREPAVQQAARSTVRVLGTACGYGIEGTGWVAGNGIIVTNAHVVAGENDTTVQLLGNGPPIDATAVWFDPKNDLAILSAPGLIAPALELVPKSQKGTSAAIVGYPENGPLDIEPARLGATTTVISENIYGSGPITRRMTSFRGFVRHGNSGGPIVDAQGRVRSTVFASKSDSDNKRGYGVPGEQILEALGSVNPAQAVRTGGCA